MIKPLRGLVVAATVAALTGCATMEQMAEDFKKALVEAGPVIDTALGCLLGGVIGYVVSGPRGAVVGCVGTGFLAWAMWDYNAKQARTAASDEKRYRKKDPDFYALARTTSSPAVKMRTARAKPTKVKPGEKLTVSADVSLALPKDAATAPVAYSVTLEKDGKSLSRLNPSSEDREAGGWLYETPISIPDSAEPGVYVIRQKVSVGSSSYDEREVKFTVAG